MAHYITDADGNLIRVAGNYLPDEVQTFLMAHPIGSYYISEISTSPAELYGGSWEKVEGQFLLGSSDNYPAGSTGGSATHTLTVDEIPSHTHSMPLSGTSVTVPSGSYYGVIGQGSGKVGATGGGQPHNNMPPYRATNVWYRYA